MPKLQRASIVPAVATALLAAWVATQHGQFTADVPLREDTFATSPYAVLGSRLNELAAAPRVTAALK